MSINTQREPSYELAQIVIGRDSILADSPLQPSSMDVPTCSSYIVGRFSLYLDIF